MATLKYLQTDKYLQADYKNEVDQKIDKINTTIDEVIIPKVDNHEIRLKEIERELPELFHDVENIKSEITNMKNVITKISLISGFAAFMGIINFIMTIILICLYAA